MKDIGIFIALAIIILYPFFWNNFANTVLNKQQNYKNLFLVTKYLDKNGNKVNYFAEDKDKLQINPEYTETDENNKFFDTKKFYLLLSVGVLSVIIGSLIENKITNVGISFGGLLTIIYATYINWNNIHEYIKLLLIGVSLLMLILRAHNGNFLNFDKLFK